MKIQVNCIETKEQKIKVRVQAYCLKCGEPIQGDENSMCGDCARG